MPDPAQPAPVFSRNLLAGRASRPPRADALLCTECEGPRSVRTVGRARAPQRSANTALRRKGPPMPGEETLLGVPCSAQVGGQSSAAKPLHRPQAQQGSPASPSCVKGLAVAPSFLAVSFRPCQTHTHNDLFQRPSALSAFACAYWPWLWFGSFSLLDCRLWSSAASSEASVLLAAYAHNRPVLLEGNPCWVCSFGHFPHRSSSCVWVPRQQQCLWGRDKPLA